MKKILFFAFIFSFPYAASAAVISFDPQETTVGTGSPFLIGITIDSDVPVNTIQGVIDIPDFMDVIDASDGNSIVNLWIERPHLNDARQLVFSGIIPGGFEGYRGKVLTLKVEAKKEGAARLSVNPSSRIYTNDENATPQPIISRPLDLIVAQGRENISNEIPDADAPEQFLPIIGSLPDARGSDAQATSSLSGGVWAVSFVAQDKRSGIEKYEVAESFSRRSVTDVRRLEQLPWNETLSPHVLADQRLASYVYVKAIDKSGNVRVERVDPQNPRPWYRSSIGYILIALVVFILLNAIRSRIKVTRRT